MASPEEITPMLPETLPDDFGEWDSEASPAAMPINPRWEMGGHSSFSETAKPHGQPTDRDGPWPLWWTSRLLQIQPHPCQSLSTSKRFSHGVGGASPSASLSTLVMNGKHGIEAHSFTETPKAFGQSVDRGATMSSLVDFPRASGSSSTAPVSLKQQKESNDGDHKASPSAKPVNSSDEWEAWMAGHSFDLTTKPQGDPLSATPSCRPRQTATSFRFSLIRTITC